MMIFIQCLTFSFSLFAEGYFWNTETHTALSQQELFEELSPHSLLLVGDIPASPEGNPNFQDSLEHHRRQGDLIRAYGIYLKSLREGLNGGYEYIAFNEQFTIERYYRGGITQEKFLGEVSWPSEHPFIQYERQFHFPVYFQGKSLGISAPAPLKRKISKTGLHSLNEEEKKLLPPVIHPGSKAYFERFKRNHPDFTKIELANHYESQLVVDSTIAWSADSHMQGSPNRMIIFVNEPSLLFDQGLSGILKASQNNFEVKTLIQRDRQPKEALADYIWVTE